MPIHSRHTPLRPGVVDPKTPQRAVAHVAHERDDGQVITPAKVLVGARRVGTRGPR